MALCTLSEASGAIVDLTISIPVPAAMKEIRLKISDLFEIDPQILTNRRIWGQLQPMF